MLQNPVLDLSRQGDYFWALLPEIFLAAWAMLVLLVDVFQKGNRSEPSRPTIPILSLVGLAITAVLNGVVLLPLHAGPGPAWVAVDGFRVYTNFILLAAAALSLAMSVGYLDRKGINRGEFHALVLFATLGMMLMAGARDLMMIFIGLEVMSVAIYVLVGFDRLDERAVEGSLKYFLLGAFSSAFFLYGIALTWGAIGTTDIPQIAALLKGGAVDRSPMLLGGMALLMVGFGFKVAAMPFHMWTPDAYEGAPTPVTSLMSTGVKAAAFASFIRVFMVGFEGVQESWMNVLFWLALLTMVAANLIAMTQGSIKRMLAYSSIAHAGYLLVALMSGRAAGASAFLFYLLVYTLMTAGAFAVLLANSRGGDERVTLEEWSGFARQKPLLAALFSIFLLSLAGFPLTAGFLGKLYILQAALEAHQTVLAVALVLSSLVSYFYYLRIIVVMYMRPARSDDEHAAAHLPGPAAFATGIAAALVVLLFFAGGLPLKWADRSAVELLNPGATATSPAQSPPAPGAVA
ncbi:MAG TPA: NADH-quinone oxidoreductase subunit N, partial [Longimicrobium sp.]|nr:NADH-quinone oxidoreductase subunit N [Longimicrobium sp.]